MEMARPVPLRCIALALAATSLAAAPASAQTGDLPRVDDIVPGIQETVGGTVGGTLDDTRQSLDQTVQPSGGSGGGGSASGGGSTGGGGSVPAPAASEGGSGGAGGGSDASGGGDSSGSSSGEGGGSGGGGAQGDGRDARRERSGADPGGARGSSERAGADDRARGGEDGSDDGFLTRTVHEIDEVVPTPIKILIAVLALLALAFGVRSLMLGARARRLTRQREELRRDVGLLQEALLPEVPERVGQLAASVAYRPAEGPAAGGDFYDVFDLPDGRVAIIVGDVSGHGHAALSRSASMRYTLRAYVEAGLGPRDALRVAERSLGDAGDGEFTTVVVAIHDPKNATLTYAMAGHPPPVLLGSARHEPVIPCSSPPVGAGFGTGQRQTTVPLGKGSLACFFTDGLIEARNGGGLLGQDRLEQLVEELGDEIDAQALLERVLQEADQAHDDMAACVVRALSGSAEAARVEELEVGPSDVGAPAMERFLAACGVPEREIGPVVEGARRKAVELGAAVVRVTIDGERRDVDITPPGPRRRLGDQAGPEPADLLTAG